MKKLAVFLMVCVSVVAFSSCATAAYDEEDGIVASCLEEQNAMKVLHEQAKASMVPSVKLSLNDVSVAYYNEGNSGDSESTPYIIDSLSDLKLLQERVNNGTEPSGKYYRLGADISLSADGPWTGIGFSNSFKGHFDGNNKTITVNVSENIITTGLFYEVESSGTAVKNLTVKGTVTASSTTANGSLTGAVAAGIVFELQSGTIENCTFEGTVEARSNASGRACDAAGIVGSMKSAGIVRNCSLNGTIRAVGDGAVAGGIVCLQSGTVSDCATSSSSTVYASGGTSYAGGIAGMAGEGRITGCTSNATISGATYRGGIAGLATSSSTLSSNSYTGASKEVGTGSSSSGGNSGNSGSGSSPYDYSNPYSSTSSSGGGGCDAGLGALGLMLCVAFVLKKGFRK